MVEQGERIEFSYEGQQLSGLVIQVDEEITVKLDSGYNMLVAQEKLKDVKLLGKHRHPVAAPQKIKQDSLLPHITILHTGGTIASKVDYETGGVSTNFSNEELLGMFPDLLQIANVSSEFVRNMWSQDIRFAHYNILAQAALDAIGKGANGIIITHGTDFLHTSAAALSFALEGINVPVMLVGSQRSSDRGSSDAATNLIGAARFIIDGKIPGVFIAMHETSDDDPIAIIDGLHARKMHSSRRDAFVSVNAPLFARVRDGKVEILDKERANAWKSRSSPKPRVMPFKEDLKIGLWKTHPQCFVEELGVYDKFDGLIIEGSGLGHGPTTGIDEFTKEEHPFIREKIGKLAKNMPVAMTVQTVFGRVNMNVYKPQRELLDRGVLGNNLDMMPEVGFIKLAWLLSNHKDEARELYGKDLRGEISACSPIEKGHGSL